ncbi:MAG: hypothetical protein NT061_09525 [Spirochaetes bacterium]|nr:hypothetical protein [Spirochaetota bacterium]
MVFARKQFAFAVLALAAACLHAQTQSTSKSVSVQLVAIVPTVLKLSLDFCTGSTAQITGYLPSKDKAGSASSALAASPGFEIQEDELFELGDARILCNTTGIYSIDVFSANGGSLRSISGSTASDIPYRLSIGGRPTGVRNGAFSFQMTGKSSFWDSPLKVALAIASIPASASSGFYGDQLLFSLSAN